VTTTRPRAAAAARLGAGLGQQKRAELQELLRGCFVRAEPWLQAEKHVSAVASGLAKRNGWAIAEHAGDRRPEGTQRLLNRAVWDTFAAMGVLRRFVVVGVDEAARRRGRRGALRSGRWMRPGNSSRAPRPLVSCSTIWMCGQGGERDYHGAFVVCAGEDRAGADRRRQWIPAEHIDDPVKSLVMGLPLDLMFRIKGQLAIGICVDAFAGGVRFDSRPASRGFARIVRPPCFLQAAAERS
jgi:hypothetical protein